MQQKKNAEAFKSIKHISQHIDIKEDANHDAIILAQIQTKDTPFGPVMETDAMVAGCPCRLREILLNLMKKDKTFASVVLSAAEIHKANTPDTSFFHFKNAFHEEQKIDPTKN